MESLAEREARIAALEAKRAERHAQSGSGIQIGGAWPPWTGYLPIEVAPGRGDLNRASWSAGMEWPVIPTALSLIGQRAISFAMLFQSQPWVAAAVMRLLTWAIRVPLKCYRYGEDPNDRLQVTREEHPVAAMLMHPWDRASQADLVMALLGPFLVHGNSVTVMDDGNRSGRITLDPKDWRFCQPLMPWRDSLEGFRFDTDMEDMGTDVSIDHVLHVHWWSPMGPIGTSPLMQLGTTLQVEDAAQRYQRASFAQGGRPPSAVTTSEAFLGMKPEDRRAIMAQLRQDINEIYGGPENFGKPALLPPGLDWKAIGQTTVEAALIDQRKIAREEIAAIYQIPPPMLGILDRATYSNIQTQREMIYTDSLGPPLVLVERAINCQLIRDLLQEDDIFVEFDFSEVLRGDRLEQINALRSAIGTGLMSPNEGRVSMGMPKVDAELMEDYFIPTNNLTPVGTMTAQELIQSKQKQPPNLPQAPSQGGRPPAGSPEEQQGGAEGQSMWIVRNGMAREEPVLNGRSGG